MGSRLDSIQTPQTTPVQDRRNVYIQQFRCLLRRITSVPALSVGTGGWPFWAAAGNAVDIADPLDLVRRKGAAAAAAPAFGVQSLGQLAIRVVRGQGADARDHGGRRASGIVGA